MKFIFPRQIRFLVIIITMLVVVFNITPVVAQSEAQLPEFRLQWSPDGTQVAVIYLSEVRIYDGQFTQYTSLPITSSGEEIFVLNVSWSPSGTYVGVDVRIGFDLYIQIWEIQSFSLVSQLQDNNVVPQLYWSPDGTQVAEIVRGVDTINIYDANIATLVSEFNPLSSGTIQRFAWNPVRDEIVVGIGTTLYFWDIASNTLRAQIDNAYNPSKAIAFSPDGSKLASVAPEGGSPIVLIWDIDTLQSTQLVGHTNGVYLFEWANSDHLASVSFDSTILVWDTR